MGCAGSPLRWRPLWGSGPRARRPRCSRLVGSVVAEHGLTSTGSAACTGLAVLQRAASSRIGVEPASPVLASGFLPTEPPGKPSLCLLTSGCRCFSLASFIPLARSLGYSAASSLCFLAHCFLGAAQPRLCCGTRGVTGL